MDAWQAAGIFPVFAVGNSGPGCSTAQSPADYPEAFAAGATDMDDVIIGASSRGPSAFSGMKPDIAAPGANIKSVDGLDDSSFAYFSGTSAASPHLAGAVALLWASTPSIRGDIPLTKRVLQESAARITAASACGDIVGQAPNNTYGAGRVDVFAALGRAATIQAEQPQVYTAEADYMAAINTARILDDHRRV